MFQVYLYTGIDIHVYILIVTLLNSNYFQSPRNFYTHLIIFPVCILIYGVQSAVSGAATSQYFNDDCR